MPFEIQPDGQQFLDARRKRREAERQRLLDRLAEERSEGGETRETDEKRRLSSAQLVYLLLIAAAIVVGGVALVVTGTGGRAVEFATDLAGGRVDLDPRSDPTTTTTTATTTTTTTVSSTTTSSSTTSTTLPPSTPPTTSAPLPPPGPTQPPATQAPCPTGSVGGSVDRLDIRRTPSGTSWILSADGTVTNRTTAAVIPAVTLQTTAGGLQARVQNSPLEAGASSKWTVQRNVQSPDDVEVTGLKIDFRFADPSLSHCVSAS
ncbi:MAG: hypothetical protein KatS3mg008_0521 [Acidimicrobiales bacterium]|nr:MAG: hypothetical protein KatS3mg008_0521 [Acidimicrobiales bacterium]